MSLIFPVLEFSVTFFPYNLAFLLLLFYSKLVCSPSSNNYYYNKAFEKNIDWLTD